MLEEGDCHVICVGWKACCVFTRLPLWPQQSRAEVIGWNVHDGSSLGPGSVSPAGLGHVLLLCLEGD